MELNDGETLDAKVCDCPMTPDTSRQDLFQYVLRLGDNALINGQRLSEWCGHGPFLEEDVGVANTALDLIGRARMLLTYAGEVEGAGRTEDDLAYFRHERDFRNFLIMELPVGDFAFTTARQFFIDVYDYFYYQALQYSVDSTLAAIAAKTLKECEYHLRHTGEWMVRLGDGTAESHEKIRKAVADLMPFTFELFDADEIDRRMCERHIGVDLDAIEKSWNEKVADALAEATLERPEVTFTRSGGRQGLHSEHMGYLLAEMQSVQRTWPGLQW